MVGSRANEELVEPRLVRPRYVMQAYDMAESTLSDTIADGVIPASKVGSKIYIRLSDVEQVMASHAISPRKKAAS